MGHMVTRCNKRNGQTMQIERNTATETDLEKVHNLRLCMVCVFARFPSGGLGDATPPALRRRFTRGLDERTNSSTARAPHLINGPEPQNLLRSWVPHTRTSIHPKRTCRGSTPAKSRRARNEARCFGPQSLLTEKRLKMASDVQSDRTSAVSAPILPLSQHYFGRQRFFVT